MKGALTKSHTAYVYNGKTMSADVVYLKNNAEI